MPSTTNYKKGDFVLVAFPFSGGAQTKVLPAMVVLNAGDADIVIARITTQQYHTPFDVLVRDWQSSGLLAPSVIRLHKLATVEKQNDSANSWNYAVPRSNQHSVGLAADIRQLVEIKIAN